MNLEPYTGLNILNVLKTDAEKGMYKSNWEQLYLNYGDNVEWQRLRHQVLLCDETRDELYKAPKPVKYVKGTRPYLEKKVNEVVKDCKSDRERVLALMVYIRDLYKSRDIEYFYGGTEEELIKKCENLCEAVGRLMVALCEVIGIPGRIVMHISGHIVSEIYFDNKWAFIDPRAGMFYLDENDRFLSIDELMRDRSYVLNQSDWVKSFVSAQWTYEQRQKANYDHHFAPQELQCFCDYSLMDADEYNFEWKEKSIDLSEIHPIYLDYVKQVFGK